jgi:uncharacterized membrane protein YfcA
MELLDFDWTLYWFMFPVALCVATTATFSGIAGSALFAPIFLVVFPLLGPEYQFSGVAPAIGAALFTATFGMSSGVIAYMRRQLIDFKSALPFILVALPVGILGAIMLAVLQEQQELLRGAYALLMAVLALILFRRREPSLNVRPQSNRGEVTSECLMREIVERDGTVYRFAVPRQGKGAFATGVGAFLTGLLGVGIGEVIMPQLARFSRVPIQVAAATSLFIVVLTVASASFTHISTLVAAGGFAAVPWNVLAYTVPAVVIGGQIGPRLQGKVSQRAVEVGMGFLFSVIGVAMAVTALRNSLFW